MQATKLKSAQNKSRKSSGQRKTFPSFLASCVRLSCSLAACILLIAAVWIVLEWLFAAGNIGEETIAAPDPLLGYVHLKNQSLTYRQEGFSRSATNSLGFREREFSLTKFPGTKRICVLGDSMTVGMEVPPEYTFTSLLERKLRQEQPTGTYEVLNCGMSGYGTGQEYLIYKEKVESLKPDVLILTYNIGDAEDNVYQRAGMNPPRPVFGVENGILRTDTSAIDSWYATNDARFYTSCEWFRRNSRVLAVLSKLNLDLSNSDPLYRKLSESAGKPVAFAWNAFLNMLPAPQPAAKNPDHLHRSICSADEYAASSKILPSVLPWRSLTISDSVKELHYSFELNRAKTEVALAIIKALNNDCKRNNCKLVVVAGPAICNSVYYFRELHALAKMAKAEKFTFIDSNKTFPARAPMQESPYFYGLHFTRAGHKLMCQAVYAGISEICK